MSNPAFKIRTPPSGPVVANMTPGYVLTVQSDGSHIAAAPGGGGGGAVSSVFGRMGAVVSAVADYAASQIINDSAVSGFSVKDALNSLAGVAIVVSNLVNGLAPLITLPNAALVSNGGGTAAAWALLTDANQVGGYQTVADLPGRNAIPAANRTVGMLVREVDTNQIWELQGGIGNGNYVDVSIGQFDTNVASATGNPVKIAAQNATGTTSVGGALTITSGTGTAVAVGTAPSPGSVSIQRGGVNVATWTALGADVITLGLPAGTGGANGPSASSAGNLRVQRNFSMMYRSTTDASDLNLIDVGTINGALSVTIGDPINSNGLQLRASGTSGIQLRAGTTNAVSASQTAVSLGVAQLTFGNTGVANPIIAQLQETTLTTSGSLTVQSQNNVTALSTGGALILRSGSGTTASGPVTLQAAGVVKLKVDDTGVGFYTHATAAQAADMIALIDSTTGAPSTTLVDVGVAFSQANINNNFASCLTQINKVRTALRATGYMA